MKKKGILNLVISLAYLAFIIISQVYSYEPGIKIGFNFINFTKDMLQVLPFAFILIGLFEVWVKRETVEKYFGHSSGYLGYIWAIILSSTTVGGAYVAFPVACSLYKKGAKLSIVLTYIGAASIARIPMTLFEASFMGIKFSIIRLLVSMPLMVFSSAVIGKHFEKQIPTNHNTASE